MAYIKLRDRYPKLKNLDGGGSQRELAALLGISQSHLCNVLNGKKRPSFPLAIRMAEVLKVPMKHLVHKDENNENKN